MNRNMDLIRRILLEIETWPSDCRPAQPEFEGVEQSTISYHAQLLYEAGYIDGYERKTQAGNTIYPQRLTWEGHEFLDAAREKKIWDKAKEAMNATGSFSFSVLKAILTKLATDEALKALVG